MFDMTARTHDLCAFATLVTATALFPPAVISLPTLMTSLVGNIVGGLIPDMDQASNKLYDLLPGSDFTGKVIGKLFLGHRNISHSLLGGYLLYKLLDFVLPRLFNAHYVDTHILLLSIMLGFASHLLADSITREGIPLFFPFTIKIGFPPLKFMRVVTDSWVEHLLVLPGVLVYTASVFYYHQSEFFTLLTHLK
jgi:inner membrane protein